MVEVKEEVLEIVQYKNTFFKPASKWNIININELCDYDFLKCADCDKEFITSIRDLDFINYCPLCGTKIITINRYSK